MKNLQLTGIGLRTPHHAEFLEEKPSVAWVEVHSENFFAEGGKSLAYLEKVREHYPVSLHGVSLSLGSVDEINWRHMKRLRDLIQRIDPCLISEHLSWSSLNGQYFHDLLPLPFTEEVIQHLVSRIKQVQDYLGQEILIENISSYIRLPHSDISEAEFLTEIARLSGCGILLDINNIYVTTTNHHEDPEKFLDSIPGEFVREIHLAGCTTSIIQEKEVVIDTHDRPIHPAVWELFRKAIQQFGVKPTIIEWDTNLPALDTLILEAYRAETIMRENYATAKRTG